MDRAWTVGFRKRKGREKNSTSQRFAAISGHDFCLKDADGKKETGRSGSGPWIKPTLI